MIPTDNILTELAREHNKIPSGRYLARVLDQELRSSTYSGRPYFALRLRVLDYDREVFAMMGAITPSNLPFMKFAMSRLPGFEVKIDLRYTIAHSLREYMDVRILEILDEQSSSL